MLLSFAGGIPLPAQPSDGVNVGTMTGHQTISQQRIGIARIKPPKEQEQI